MTSDNPDFQSAEAKRIAPESPAAQPPLLTGNDKRPFSVDQLFVGSGELRVPWRLLVYIAAGVAILYGLSLPLRFWHGHSRLLVQLFSELALMAAVLVPAVLMGRVEGRGLTAYGLPGRAAFGKLFWVGAAWGLLAITLLLAGMRVAGSFDFGGLALHGPRIARFAVYWGVFFLAVGFFEEFLFRGYTQFTLAKGIGFWPAAAVLSAAFGAVHLGNGGESWIGVTAAGMIGFFFCLTLRRTGNLWFAVGFHMSFDWGETFLYSVPNSGTTAPGHLLNSSFHGAWWLTGGSVGPEGSVFIFPLIALLWIAFDRMYPQVKNIEGRKPA